MANWAYTSYAVEGPGETLERIEQAILHPDIEEDSAESWEGNVLRALGIEWKQDRSDGGYYMRGFIQDKPWFNGDTLMFYAEEAWGVTDLNEVLEKNLPGVKVYYQVEEEGEEIYATNDKEGKYFPERYYVDICAGDCYDSDYFTTEENVWDYLSRVSDGKITTQEDVDAFNQKAEEECSDEYIKIHKFTIVE